MRLEKVRSGHALKYRLLLGLIRLMSRQEPLDVVKTLLYRPERFGKPFSTLTQAVLRRTPSEWRVGELELFAAFVSKLNQCVF